MELSRLEESARDPRIDEYLTRVVAQLPRRMSPECRLEQRSELEAHLHALVAAHMELGSSEDAAVLAALEQFGRAEDLGRRLSREWKRAEQLHQPTKALLAVAATFLYTAGSTFLFPSWPALDPGPGAVTSCLNLALPCLAGYCWARHRTSGSRAPGIVLFAALLAGALLPLQQEYQDVPSLQLAARILLLMRWMIVAGSTAGLTETLKVLGDRWRKRRPA